MNLNKTKFIIKFLIYLFRTFLCYSLYWRENMKTLIICLLFLQLLIFSFNFSLFGHHGAIWQLKIFDNMLYSSGSDGIINIWNIT